MSDHGPAQLELIRRYARTLREMHADAMRLRPSPAADRAGRIERGGVPVRPAAEALAQVTPPPEAAPQRPGSTLPA